MSGRYFGTDGIRDRVDGPFLDPVFVRRLGAALGQYLRDKFRDQPCRVVIGRDTRPSGESIVTQLAIGLTFHDIKVVEAGIIPTPAVALAVRKLRAQLGISVTASHNPASDNGIKLFGRDGCKLSDEEETAIERLIDATQPIPAYPNNVARLREGCGADSLYIDFCASLLPASALQGWKIVCDCANGASWQTTPLTLQRLGAEVIAIGNSPNGQDINSGCGSEHPERLCALVQETGAHLGIAHDGDADRLVVCDELGKVLDGDELLAILALYLNRNRRLPQSTVVVTVMSNQGLDVALRESGIKVDRAGVGDRQVIQRMARVGAGFGGESSGHIIIGDVAPTGDALVAALHVMAAMRHLQKPLSELRKCVRLYPNLLKAIVVERKIPIVEIPALQEELERIDADLGDRGRVLVRYSGTEPKIRLLVEAESRELCGSIMQQLVSAIRTHLEVI